MDKMNLQPRKS